MVIILLMANKQQYKKFESVEEAEKYAERTGNVIMFMENQVIDGTSFAKHHPGGAKNIINSKNMEITEEIRAHFPLAEKLAESMVIGYIGK
jgi:cytochrome b involved in lipid metabolism